MHSEAPTAADTDWRQVLALYDQLLTLTPTPVVALNRAVAVNEVSGPAAALAIVDLLDLTSYQPIHAVRADLLRRVGRLHEAAARYAVAIRHSEDAAERYFLRARAAGLDQVGE